MNLEEQFAFLNFWIGKETGSYYTVSELEQLVHAGSTALFNDYRLKASTSQSIKDALSPFRKTFNFDPNDTVGGVLEAPDDYSNLLDLEIRYSLSGRGMTIHVPIKVYNEDERAERLNSQVNPVTITSPIGEQTGEKQWQLYPESQYFGKLTYYKYPSPPVFGYSVVSGRVLVYDAGTSTQLEWKEAQHTEVLLKALSSIGINLRDNEVAQWAEMKTQQNFSNFNKL